MCILDDPGCLEGQPLSPLSNSLDDAQRTNTENLTKFLIYLESNQILWIKTNYHEGIASCTLFFITLCLFIRGCVFILGFAKIS